MSKDADTPAKRARFLSTYAERIRYMIKQVPTPEERAVVMTLALKGYCQQCWRELPSRKIAAGVVEYLPCRDCAANV